MPAHPVIPDQEESSGSMYTVLRGICVKKRSSDVLVGLSICLDIMLIAFVCVEIFRRTVSPTSLSSDPDEWKRQGCDTISRGINSTPRIPNWTTPKRRSCNTTFVTQYFNIPSKHTMMEYASWISNLEGMCLLVFTDSPQLWRHRDHDHDVVIIETKLCTEARVLNQTGCFWQEQRALDPEAAIHRTPLVYLAWNLKPYFVKEGARLNPFDSQWFFWIDVGFMRSSTGGGDKTWLYPAVHGDARDLVPDLSQSAMHFLTVHEFPAEEMSGHFHYSTHQDRIAGNLWGGHAECVAPWVDLYYQTLLDYVDRRGWFVGKDQNIMNSLCTENHARCILVDPRKYLWENPWVGMWECLLNQRECGVYTLKGIIK